MADLREQCLKCDGWCDICGNEKCLSCKDEHRCGFIKELDNAPTVDAVPMEFHEKCVRCTEQRMNTDKRDVCRWCSRLNRKGKIITDVTFAVIDDDFGQYVPSLKIKYCPFCGRRLWEEKENNQNG